MISIVTDFLIITSADCKVVYVDDPANRELVTLTEYIFLSNFHVLLIITFKGAYYLCKYFKNDIDCNT